MNLSLCMLMCLLPGRGTALVKSRVDRMLIVDGCVGSAGWRGGGGGAAAALRYQCECD